MKKQIIETVKERIKHVNESQYRESYHIMADIGWISDPNGLSCNDGMYHIFFQYTPAADRGLSKSWGHYTTKDFHHFTDKGPAMTPESWMDKDGCYSGSGIFKDGVQHLFYTGNVLEEGDHDYILSGRGHYVNHITSLNGTDFSEKECLLQNDAYPANMSCHVRDPKIFFKDDKAYIVLGARTRDDRGCALLYSSTDSELRKWQLVQVIDSVDHFGYMWECPDLMEFGDTAFLMCCPQGVQLDTMEHQNVYQNGYFTLERNEEGQFVADHFHTFDHGFDFYAPQSLIDDQGRRILIGWLAVPDAPYTYPEVEEGWIHTLSLPRELTKKDNQIYQYPIEEILNLESNTRKLQLAANQKHSLTSTQFHLHFDAKNTPFKLELRHDAVLVYDGKICTLSLKESGAGRTSRNVRIPNLEQVDIFSDRSSLEIFFNHGQEAVTTRIYDTENSLLLSCDRDLDCTLGDMNAIEFDYSQIL